MVEETTRAIGSIVARKQSRQSERGMVVMSLGDHLDELRTRLIHALLGLAPLFALGLYFGDRILVLLTRPMRAALQHEGLPAKMLATGVFETFGTWILVGVLVTVVIGFPWILYQAWKFVSPGLYAEERRFAYFLFPLSLVLSITGVLFMYLAVLPVMLVFMVHFTTGMVPEDPGVAEAGAGVVLPNYPVIAGDPKAPRAGDVWINSELNQIRVCLGVADDLPIIRGSELIKATGIVHQPRVREYVDQIVQLAIAFALTFQAPVVVLLLGWTRIVRRESLTRNRRIILFVIAIVAAVMAPPDPLSMMMLGVPLWILFEFGILLLRIFPSPSALSGKEPAGKEGNTDDEAHP
jgi:sec-independent protein translocase protein TatC